MHNSVKTNSPLSWLQCRGNMLEEYSNLHLENIQEILPDRYTVELDSTTYLTSRILKDRWKQWVSTNLLQQWMLWQ